MIIRLAICLFFAMLLTGCKGKKKKVQHTSEAFFPVRSFLQSQVKQMDSSLYRIEKVQWDGSSYDTTVVRREEFHTLAQDFLDLPDINSKELRDDYNESNTYDELMQRAVFSYYTTGEDLEIRKEDVLIKPGTTDSSQVETIIIDKVKTAGDSTVEKNMVWEVGRRFTVVTKTQKGTAPEKVRKLIVFWNDFNTTEEQQ